MNYEAIVIGAGVQGLCAAYHLHSQGVGPIAIVEQARIGHDLGSSRGETRIFRSTYDDRLYADLAAAARVRGWSQLEQDLGVQLLHPVRGVCFGPRGGLFDRYAAAMESSDAVVPLDLESARKQFPELRLEAPMGILDDTTCAVIAAERTLFELARWRADAGITLLESTQVRAIDVDSAPVAIDTSRGILRANHAIVTAGAWSGRLLPFLDARLEVIRQTVAYVELDLPRKAQQVPQFPIWMYLGREPNDMYYGLPELERKGVKVARHVTRGRDEDPDQPPAGVDEIELAALLDFVRGTFAAEVKDVVRTESCVYTCTRTEDFLVDLHPQNGAIVIGTGFSGHSFKFAPLIGRALAELATKGRTTIGAFEALRSRMAIRRG